MVTAETRRKFETRGVTLVEPGGGAAACLDEILRAPSTDVEVILGAGPWESREARLEVREMAETAVAAPGSPWPLLARARNVPGPRGGRVLVTTLSSDRDLYLDQHRLDGTPVLPAAAAVEIAAEAAATVWPGWQVAEVANLRLLSGFKLEGDRPRVLEVVVLGSEHGDATGFDATVELRSAGEGGRPHYRASIRLVDALPSETAPGWAESFSPGAAPLSAREAYRSVLSHGPLFQAVTHLIGLDETGVLAEMQPSRPADFVVGAGPRSAWLFDPALVDAAAQIAWLWSCQYRGTVALPNRFGRLRRFNGAGVPRRMIFAVQPGTAEHEVKADIVVLDEEGAPVFAIDDLESTANASLNRVRGWAGEIRV